MSDEKKMQTRWWARFAVRQNMDSDAPPPQTNRHGFRPPSMNRRAFLLHCETEPFTQLVDITDCCASNRVSAEIWYAPADALQAYERMHAGWIDELGRLHARRADLGAARRLALVIASNGGEGSSAAYDFEESARAIELWATIARPKAERSVYPFHRFLVGQIDVG